MKEFSNVCYCYGMLERAFPLLVIVVGNSYLLDFAVEWHKLSNTSEELEAEIDAWLEGQQLEAVSLKAREGGKPRGL